MKYSLATLALAATGALAYSNGTIAYTTEIVTALTTYCPEATQITQGGTTYTITEATTLTITNCPCTLTRPISTPTSAPVVPPPSKNNGTTVLYTSCPSSSGSGSTVTVVPPPYTSAGGNGGAKTSGIATGTGSPVAPTSPQYTGAGGVNKVGGLIVAVAGVAVLAL